MSRGLTASLILAALTLAPGCRFFEHNPEFARGEAGDEVDSATESDEGGDESETTGPETTESTETETTQTETTESETSDTETTESETSQTESTETESTESGETGDVEGMIADPNNEMLIDATEVTVSDYAPFFMTYDPRQAPPPPAGCEGNSSLEPNAWLTQLGEPDRPVVSVDWCDAYAYCEWQGKHLCGQVGGGPTPENEDETQASEWYRACTAGGSLYPYGNDYIVDLCNGEAMGLDEAVPVGSLVECVGGFEDLFDMSGNVWEWTNSCYGDENECLRRGGSFDSDLDKMRCDGETSRGRMEKLDNTGLRCCATP